MKNTDISTDRIEDAIAELDDGFSISELAAKLDNRSQALRDRLFRLLDGDERFFSDGDRYFRREKFLARYQFAVTPDDWEFTNRILVPGHRFSPYLPAEVFPSEAEILWQGKALERREVTAPLGHLFHYHLLLGSEGIFEHLAAEHPANAGLLRHADTNAQVTLSVYDLSSVLPADPELGDALIFTVEDYSQGRLSLEYRDAARRSDADRKAWVAAADRAVTRVIDRFGEYPDVPEQLTWAVFFGQKELKNAAASWDEYLRLTKTIYVSADRDHALLAKIAADTESQNAEPTPEEVEQLLSISDTPLRDPAKLAASLNSSLSPIEIDSFILDACYARELDFSDLFRRLFGAGLFSDGDDPRKAALLNYLEERAEHFQENYNRADDEIKAELRAMILEGVQRRCDYLSEIADSGTDLELHRENIAKISAFSRQLEMILKQLNDPAFVPDETGLQNLNDTAEKLLDALDELFSQR